MPQSPNHEALSQVAFSHGWTLWEYGVDSECIVGGKDAPHLALIWMKPCVWDDQQQIPVGCHCCTDLSEALWEYSGELQNMIEDRRIRLGVSVPPPVEAKSPETAKPLGARLDWLPPYRAR